MVEQCREILENLTWTWLQEMKHAQLQGALLAARDLFLGGLLLDRESSAKRAIRINRADRQWRPVRSGSVVRLEWVERVATAGAPRTGLCRNISMTAALTVQLCVNVDPRLRFG